MKTLAIDTSSKRCSVCIFDDNNILTNLFNDDERTHSVKLMPMIDKAFRETSLTLDDISLLSCAIGPGSFTGVRIGVATIKAFADVKKIPIVGVSSLESLAYNVKEMSLNSGALVCSLIDAKNENVYCGLYSFSEDTCTQEAIFAENIHTTVNKISEFLNNSNVENSSGVEKKYSKSNFSNIIFVGDGSKVYSELLSSSFKNSTFASDEQNIQNGVSLAKAGLAKFEKGQYGDSSSISPIYLKKSQAERTLEEKILISEMNSEDIETITPDFEKNFDKFWNINNLKNDFNNPNSKYFVARLDNEIVGFAGFLKICDEANIMNVVTKINKRNIGVGGKLLEVLIASAKENNCTSITLEVNEHNTPAIHLYEKFNFKRIGLRKKYYNNTDDAIIMNKF